MNEQSQAGVSIDEIEPWEKLLGDISLDINLTGHFNARTLDEASYLLRTNEKSGTQIIAGGTDVLRLMRHKYLPTLPAVLVNIKGVPGLTYIKKAHEVIEIGALTCLADIETSALIKTDCRVLSETASIVGSPQIRNMVTIAGSICQNLSCWYYRASKNYFHCLRKGGGGCPAIDGDNRWMFSIFGTPREYECYATCQSDMAITLSALNASIKTTQRTILIEQFYAPVASGNILRQDEIITAVQIPALSTTTKANYLKFSIRKSIDHPLVSVACVTNDEQTRVVVGGVFLMPYRVKAVESVHTKRIGETLAEKVADAAVAEAAPMSMNAWKVQVAKTLVKRALLALTQP